MNAEEARAWVDKGALCTDMSEGCRLCQKTSVDSLDSGAGGYQGGRNFYADAKCVVVQKIMSKEKVLEDLVLLKVE